MDLRQTAEFLRSHDQYRLVTHRRPDGDTLGSAGALCHALRRMGKTAWLCPNREITESYLPYVGEFFEPEGYVPETAVAVDVAEEGILCRDYTGGVDLWIDHHATRKGVREPGLIRPDRAACGEIVLELIEELLGAPDKTEADLLYIAVSTDTGCYLYANVNPDTFRCSARLLEYGADQLRINKIFFRTKTKARMLLESMICENILSYRNDELNIAVLTLDMIRRSGAVENDMEDLANLPGLVAGNRVSVLVRELSADPARCKVSVRTDGGVDASRVCALFGGGGHKMASGCELDAGPMETAEALRRAVEEAWA